MDWKDPVLKFPCSRLSAGLKEFTSAVLQETKDTALGLLDELRSCRVTLNQIRKVESVEYVDSVSDRVVVERELPEGDKATTPAAQLDQPTAAAVKTMLLKKVEDYRARLSAQYQVVVPRDKASFEAAFDTFVEACLMRAESDGAEGDAVRDERSDDGQEADSWFEEQVQSGDGQPHLWKAFVVFQNQLREACEKKSKEPLPPPLFSMLPAKGGKVESQPADGKKKKHRKRQSRSKLSFSSMGSGGDNETTPRSSRRGSISSLNDSAQGGSPISRRQGRKKSFPDGDANLSCLSSGFHKQKATEPKTWRPVDKQSQQPGQPGLSGKHVAIIGPNGQFIPVS